MTNKQYRVFIAWLESSASEYEAWVPHKLFKKELNHEAKGMVSGSGFAEYFDSKQNLTDLFRSEHDDYLRFNGDDQSVLGISWYAARACCLWLSFVESKGKNAAIYRLPTEIEWEWAAGGRREYPTVVNNLRYYPWPDAAGDPDLQLTKYTNHVGQKMPIGSYPKGATPEGLYDMAGNVWESMAHWYKINKTDRFGRGGSWDNEAWAIDCILRESHDPDVAVHNTGFRVVRSTFL